MSVIWSGVTEEGAVVPVQVDETGKVIATAAVPGGDYVKKAGDNMTGDLTLGTDRITLNAADGSATFTDKVTVGDGVSGPYVISYADGRLEQAADSSNAYILRNKTTTLPVIQFDETGSASFAGAVSTTSYYKSQRSDGSFYVFQGVGPTGESIRMNADGSAMFAGGKCGFTSEGELIFTSRNTRYKAVVQDQLVIAEPYTRQMELKEKAEQFIADKRETKPSDPSDPSDPQVGVSMDIDNSSPKRD